MARETKVGLLAGLAFIICFAVILSNRGRSDHLPSQWLNPAGQAQAPAGPPPGQTPNSGFTLSPSGQIVFNTGTTGPSPVVSYDRGQGRWVSPEHAALQSMTEPVPPAHADPNAQRTLEEHLARVAQGSRSSPSPGPSSPGVNTALPVSGAALSVHEQPADKPDAASEYVVAAGDTLSKIAEKRYGTRSKRVIDAIIDLNRGRISNPNEIRAGMTLALPGLENAAESPKVERTTHPQPQASTKPLKVSAPEPKSAAGFRWYQVRKNDRYASIARDQLGSDTRWHEIFELNKDKFPDPNQIREGVRIKIPTTR